MKKIAVAFAMACIASTLMNATVVSSGTFLNWTFSGIGNGGMTLEGSGGNPGERVNVTTITAPASSAFAYGLGVDHDVSVNELLSGAFTLTIDVLSGAGDFGAGQGFALLVQQGSDIYADPLGVTGFPHNSFNGLTFTGTFSVGSFEHWVGGGAATPDFTGATTTFFGFSGYNTRSSTFTLTQYYDNFNLSYGATGTPEPSTLLLTGFGGLALVWRQGRRRNRA